MAQPIGRTALIFVILTVSVLSIALGGCARPLDLAEEPYRDAAEGYELQYPLGWQHITVERLGGELFHAPGLRVQDIVDQRVVPEVPIVLVIAGSLDQILHVPAADASDSAALLRRFLGWLLDVRGARLGRVRQTVVDEQVGARADFRWTWMLDGTEMAGRAVAVHRGDRAFFIEAVGRADDWRGFAPTFEAIVDSVRLD